MISIEIKLMITFGMYIDFPLFLYIPNKNSIITKIIQNYPAK